jgi:hypothetical protein
MVVFSSNLNKAKRLELVLYVSEMNFVVFQFLKSYTKGPVNVYDWPLIKHGDWTYNPLIPNELVLIELEKSEVEVPGIL